MNIYSEIARWANYQWRKGFVKCPFLWCHTFYMPEKNLYQSKTNLLTFWYQIYNSFGRLFARHAAKMVSSLPTTAVCRHRLKFLSIFDEYVCQSITILCITIKHMNTLKKVKINKSLYDLGYEIFRVLNCLKAAAVWYTV